MIYLVFLDCKVIYKRKHRFQNPLHQNYKHIKSIRDSLSFLESQHIQGLVVFVGQAEFKTERPTGVYSLQTMVQFLRTMSLQEVISENRMQFCIGRLEYLRLALTKKTDVQHRLNLMAKKVGNDLNFRGYYTSTKTHPQSTHSNPMIRY